MKISQEDKFFMNYAIRLASRNIGNTGKNPSVACVLTSNNKILSYGITGNNGSPHAEYEAIKKINKLPKNVTAYVTLEPCSHVGKNPSCTDLLIKSKINRVVIAQVDPNPLVNGKGIKILKENGIKVDYGLLEKKALKNNYGFINNIKKKYPEVNVKIASSKNGITIPEEGKKWITNSLSRSYGHILRSNHDAIMVGIKTVLSDNPSLNCRLKGLESRSPIKIIVDTNLKTPLSCNLVKNSNRDLIIFSNTLNNNKIISFKNAGVEVIHTNKLNNGFLDIREILFSLNKKGINRLLIEGGSTLAYSFINGNFVNEVYWFSSKHNITNSKLSNESDEKLYSIKKGNIFLIKDCINLRDNKLEIFKLEKD